MTTIGQRVENRHTVGFDYLRLILAIAVMVWHQIVLQQGIVIDSMIARTLWAVPVRIILPLFFALSGFLVASSLIRLNSLKPFLINRILRIGPALAVEVLLSAVIIGPLVTTLDPKSYFTNIEFLKYLFNVVGWIHLNLPGVFPNSKIPGVMNSSLWTVPYELECYIALSAIFLIRIVKLEYAIASIVSIGMAILLWKAPNEFEYILGFKRSLIIFFLSGVLIFLLRYKLPTSPLIIATLSIFCFILLSVPVLSSISPFFVAYLAAALGCTNPPKNKLLRSGDYSYGIYLYAFPMQQCAMLIVGPDNPVLCFCLSLIVVSLFAAFSWHYVEKPTLRFKAFFTDKSSQVAGAQNEGLTQKRTNK